MPPHEIIQPSRVRALPGELNDVPVFNSNSPEVVSTEGILLSTFPPAGKKHPQAHLDFAFQGRFDIFSHHLAKARTSEETHTLFQGILLHNPNSQPATIEILQGLSYLTKPHAPFINLSDYKLDPRGNVYSGPGSRLVNEFLRGNSQGNWPSEMVLQPQQSKMLLNMPIPVGRRTPSSNARSTLMRLQSDRSVYVANLAMYAPLNEEGQETMPQLEDWKKLLKKGDLAGPRDLKPTPLGVRGMKTIYSRVAGVAKGSRWEATLTNSDSDRLAIPTSGRAIAYGLSTLHRGRLGTNQVQSGEMLVRYEDTAYYAHGNYGVEYDLTIPLYNPTEKVQTVNLSLSTPLKQDDNAQELLFFTPPQKQVFFRGTVRLKYKDQQGNEQTRYVHLVQQRGHQGKPLISLQLEPQQTRTVEVNLIYPPDSTPPQVLTIEREQKDGQQQDGQQQESQDEQQQKSNIENSQ